MKTLLVIFSSLSFMNVASAHDFHPDAHLIFNEGEVHAHVYWENGPNDGSESILRLELKNAADHTALQIQDQITLDLWMPAMNHGSSPTLVQPIKDALGAYRISQIYFLMPGPWELRLTIGTETKSFPAMVPADQPGSHSHH